MTEIRYVRMEDKEFWYSLDRHLPEAEFDGKVRDKRGYVLEEAGKPGPDSAPPAASAPARACPVQKPKAGVVPVPAVVGGAWGRGGERPANQMDVAKPVAEGAGSDLFLSSWPVHP